MALINLSPDKVEKIVIACCSLHNLLSTKNPSTKMIYTQPGTFDSETRNGDKGSSLKECSLLNVGGVIEALKVQEKYMNI